MSSDADFDSYKPKFTRTKTGCLRCRKGKHKCDEQRPICRRCQHARGECVYPPPPTRRTRECRDKRIRLQRSEESSRFEELNEDGQTVSVGREGDNDGRMDGSPSITTTPSDLLTLAFPDPLERELMNHLLSYGTIIMYAIAKPNQPVPFLDIAQCLHSRRGTSYETDAVLLSLISIAAVHQASIFTQQEKKYITKLPGGRWGTSSVHTMSPTLDNQTRMRKIGVHCSNASLELCKITMALKMSDGQSTRIETSNVLLSSIVCVIISQVLAGRQQWNEAFRLALGLIETRGGPAKMLADAEEDSRSALLRVRTLLENLVVIDVCHCLATGSAPRLMVEPFAPWWFDYADEVFGPDDHDTVHHSYGVDRGIVELMNRVNILYNERVILTSLADTSYVERHDQKVQDLLLELEVWENSFKEGNLSRLEVGNVTMMHTMRVVIYVDLMGSPHSHPVVQASASAALRLLERSLCLSVVVGLLLPKIILGSMMFDEEGRHRARSLITGLRSTGAYSYDVEEASAMLEQLYTLRDQGQADPSWRTIAKTEILLI
ncbi:fungal-specific transcription factor domain-domain-containing protein [Naematelia encephala]|uniref:Fungal-specific transcription factor domain-domain-containing protein n=1 Tax=Naematelia encephala TaxID=71784 RepID=A0A1Y2AWP0_9TREE|nr:fungal-specific transcription factor domain-domain-containing protein [Naematelia encephala]